MINVNKEHGGYTLELTRTLHKNYYYATLSMKGCAFGYEITEDEVDDLLSICGHSDADKVKTIFLEISKQDYNEALDYLNKKVFTLS